MPTDTSPLLTTERLWLALLPPDAAWRVVAYHEANREHFGPVSPAEASRILDKYLKGDKAKAATKAEAAVAAAPAPVA